MTRPCTCHPDDHPPVPCQQKFALAECRESAAQALLDRAYELIGNENWVRDYTLFCNGNSARSEKAPNGEPYRAMLKELCEAAGTNLEYTRYTGIWQRARALLEEK